MCNAVWNAMREECMPKPDENTWKTISEGFSKNNNFPNCVGAVDGKHVRILKPAGSGSDYYNYKHFFSILLLAVADSNCRFTYVDVGAFGKEADPTVFEKSSLWQGIQKNTINIPESSSVVGIPIKMPYAFVGDEAFGLSKHMLRPYSGKHLEMKKRVFNYRLSRARRVVECSFGILTNKWRIFHRPIDVKPKFAVDIVKCCCVLHNFVREREGYNFEDTLTVHGLYDFEQDTVRTVNSTVNRYRNALTEYFISDVGKVPWQYERM